MRFPAVKRQVRTTGVSTLVGFRAANGHMWLLRWCEGCACYHYKHLEEILSWYAADRILKDRFVGVATATCRDRHGVGELVVGPRWVWWRQPVEAVNLDQLLGGV